MQICLKVKGLKFMKLFENQRACTLQRLREIMRNLTQLFVRCEIYGANIWLFRLKSVYLRHEKILKSVCFKFRNRLKSVNRHAVQEDYIIH